MYRKQKGDGMVVDTKNDIVWESFVPVRDSIRQIIDGGNEVDPVTLQSWQDTRNKIVAKYYHLVQKVAEQMHKRNQNVEEDALASMGVDGLYDAVDGFELGKNVKFETYAAYRIKGSIVDAIRRDDWVPRLVRSRAKKLDKLREQMMVDGGEFPSDEDLANEMGISMTEYHELVKASELRSVQSLNAAFNDCKENENCSGAHDITIMSNIADKVGGHPLSQLMQEEMKAKLFGKGFTPMEREIIKSYYFLNRSMKEIADSIGLSESRVSQMNTAIVERLKERVRRNPEFFGKELLEILT